MALGIWSATQWRQDGWLNSNRTGNGRENDRSLRQVMRERTVMALYTGFLDKSETNFLSIPNWRKMAVVMRENTFNPSQCHITKEISLFFVMFGVSVSKIEKGTFFFKQIVFSVVRWRIIWTMDVFLCSELEIYTIIRQFKHVMFARLFYIDMFGFLAWRTIKKWKKHEKKLLKIFKKWQRHQCRATLFHSFLRIRAGEKLRCIMYLGSMEPSRTEWMRWQWRQSLIFRSAFFSCIVRGNPDPRSANCYVSGARTRDRLAIQGEISMPSFWILVWIFCRGFPHEKRLCCCSLSRRQIHDCRSQSHKKTRPSKHITLPQWAAMSIVQYTELTTQH